MNKLFNSLCAKEKPQDYVFFTYWKYKDIVLKKDFLDFLSSLYFSYICFYDNNKKYYIVKRQFVKK